MYDSVGFTVFGADYGAGSLVAIEGVWMSVW